MAEVEPAWGPWRRRPVARRGVLEGFWGRHWRQLSLLFPVCSQGQSREHGCIQEKGQNIVKEEQQRCSVIWLERKQVLGSVKGEIRERKLRGRRGNRPVSLSSRFPSHYLHKVPLPLAFPKAVRDRGLAEGRGGSPQLEDNIKIALEKKSFWPFTVPV